MRSRSKSSTRLLAVVLKMRQPQQTADSLATRERRAELSASQNLLVNPRGEEVVLLVAHVQGTRQRAARQLHLGLKGNRAHPTVIVMLSRLSRRKILLEHLARRMARKHRLKQKIGVRKAGRGQCKKR